MIEGGIFESKKIDLVRVKGGGGEECWPTEVERHGNDGVKSSTRRKRFLFIYLPRADSVAALRAHPGAEGRKRKYGVVPKHPWNSSRSRQRER